MQSTAQRTGIAQFHDLMTKLDGPSWLIPPMGSILQYQGANSRALTCHLLQCQEDDARDPQLTQETIHHVLETVINKNWLQLEFADELKAAKMVLNHSRLFWSLKQQPTGISSCGSCRQENGEGSIHWKRCTFFWQ